MREPCATSIAELADQAVALMEARDINPHRLIVAGHSMGAQVAYEVCLRLEHRNLAPRGLVLSGCHAPHLHGYRRISHLEDRAFLEALAAMGGNASELLNEPSLWPMFIPMLRADFLATETYWYPQEPAIEQRLQTPARLVWGREDKEVRRSEIDAWNGWLRHVRESVVMEGDHFHIVRHPLPFLDCIRQFGTTVCFQ